MKPPTIRIWWMDGCWHAESSNPEQGHVGATDEIVLKVVARWLRGEKG